MPQVLNGYDTTGRTGRRPVNPPLGQPFYDEDLDALLIFGVNGWEVANWSYYSQFGIVLPKGDEEALALPEADTSAIVTDGEEVQIECGTPCDPPATIETSNS